MKTMHLDACPSPFQPTPAQLSARVRLMRARRELDEAQRSLDEALRICPADRSLAATLQTVQHALADALGRVQFQLVRYGA